MSGGEFNEKTNVHLLDLICRDLIGWNQGYFRGGASYDVLIMNRIFDSIKIIHNKTDVI